MHRNLLLMMLFFAFTTASQADWPQFRGPSGNGVALEQQALPETWNAETNLSWKLALPGQGWSQPITHGNMAFVTTATSDKPTRPKGFMTGAIDPRSRPGSKIDAPKDKYIWRVHAVDLDTGKELWQKTICSGVPQQPIHPSNTYATETPATDGKAVYAYFGATGTLVALNFEGEELWRREFGTFPILEGFGTGASLTLVEGKVIVECYNEKQSFQAAVDTNTGSEVWRNALIPGSSWATPLVWRNSLRTELISCGKGLVTSVDPQTGKEYWRLGKFDTAFASSPTCAGDRLYFGASSPGSSSPFFVVQAGAQGDISLEKGTSSNAFVVWHKNGMGPGMCSVLEKDGLLYTMGTGILACYDAQTGERIYRERIPKAGSFAANPISHGDKLYFLDENGVTHVIQAGRQFKLLGSHPLPRETYWSSPALGKNCLLIRGTEHLYCIREPNK